MSCHVSCQFLLGGDSINSALEIGGVLLCYVWRLCCSHIGVIELCVALHVVCVCRYGREKRCVQIP